MTFSCLLAILTVSATPPVAPATPPAEPAPVAPAPGSAPSPPDPQTKVDELLTRLETAGSDLRDFSAGIAHERFDALLDETERRYGRLVLEGQGKDRKLALLFEEFIDGSGRADRSRDHWLILDGWIIDVNEKAKTFVARQVAPPGSAFDPLKLGEGPFPLPLGQPKAEVLRQFRVEDLARPELALFKSLPDCPGLRLVPREGTEFAKETKAVEVWYETESLSPLAVIIRQVNGDRIAVRLIDPARNAGLSEADRALLVKPEVDPTEWSIDTRPLAKAPT